MLPYSEFSYYQSQRGAILIVFAVCVLTLFILLGLAIDSGNLYSARLAAQASADAGALAGASLKVLHKTDAEAQAGAEDVAVMNLKAKGFPNSAAAKAVYDAGDNKISVTVTTNVGLYILKLLPGIGSNFKTVNTRASAVINPAVVSIILDTSESMACPAEVATTSPSCACAPACSQTDGKSKIEALKQAVTTFVNFFDPGRDRINLVAFGTGAEVLVKMKNSDTFSLQAVQDAIDELVAKGATNPSDAFYRAYFDVNRVGQADNVSYVYFSDGAPTAARFVFTDAKRTNYKVIWSERKKRIYPSDRGMPSWAKYDFINWGVVKDGVSVPNKLFLTPPYKDKGNNLYWNPRLLGAKDPREPPAVDAQNTTISSTEPWLAFSNWVEEGMKIRLPNGSARKLGFGARWNGDTYEWDEWTQAEHLRLYADNALVVSDFLREKGGVWYSIGYGKEATRGADPYQNVEDPTLRKDYFLTRVCVDPCGIADQHPPFPGVPTLLELTTNSPRSGVYFPAADAERLKSVFLKIARTIKLRLIQ